MFVADCAFGIADKNLDTTRFNTILALTMEP